MDTPPAAPSRPVAGILVGVFAGVGVLAYALTKVPEGRVQSLLGPVLGLVNLVVMMLFLARARWRPEERRGWLILAGSIPLVLVANGILSQAGSLERPTGAMDWVYLAVMLVIALVQAWGLLALPWRRSEKASNLLDLLGSLLFGSSIFLLLWMLGLWQQALHGHGVIHARILALAGRLAITFGVSVYLFGQDPRRARGPLGWVLVSMVTFCVSIGLLRPFMVNIDPNAMSSPWFSLFPLSPALLGLAAWCPYPVEPSPGQKALPSAVTEVVPYVPYLIAGGVLGLFLIWNWGPLTPPFITFLAITSFLVLRQFLLLREVKASRDRLEERVAQRTQSLERMQAVLLKTERMNALATVGAGLTHDLNNLLGVIQNYAGLMKLQLEEGTTPTRRDLERILDASAKAGNLTQRLMAFGRKEDAPAGAPPRAIAETIGSTEEILRMLLPSSIGLDLEIDPATHPLPVEPALLEQVLVNLVSNAKDAMPRGGRVTIGLHPGLMEDGAPAVILAVSDTGVGIPAELQELIFSTFFTTKPEGKGTGLGLASVRTLMEAQGGTVDVESSPSRGTTFKLAFPM